MVITRMDSTLLELKSLQFSDKTLAEARLLDFMKRIVDPEVCRVILNPKPESLNSINGFAEFRDGERLFFKTHTEEEDRTPAYYNATVLGKAGYPVVVPKQVRTKPGQQIAFYEIISYPTLFDIVKSQEDLELSGKPTQKAGKIIKSQRNLDKRIFQVYKKTLTTISQNDNSAAPIRQLFFNRLSEGGRVDLFYSGKELALPCGNIPYKQLSELKWRINGIEYSESIGQIIRRSKELLDPDVETLAIVGHGDAHNGNVFVDESSWSYYYFDPAFAGTHNPFLDMAKPMFHNVFARWMYFPGQVDSEFSASCKIENGTMVVESDYKPSTLRQAFLESKVGNVLGPVVGYLQKNGMLSADWQDYLRSALFCCPFLTVNLAAESNPNGALAEKYSPKIKLLGLCMAVMMGSRPVDGSDMLSSALDSAEPGVSP